jgi:hypothetical protein
VGCHDPSASRPDAPGMARMKTPVRYGRVTKSVVQQGAHIRLAILGIKRRAPRREIGRLAFPGGRYTDGEASAMRVTC